MPNPFTPEEIAEYLKDKEFWQGLWEPRRGDFVVPEAWTDLPNDMAYGLVLDYYPHKKDEEVFVAYGETPEAAFFSRKHLIPLFTEGQLLRMLKATGWWLAGLHERPDGSWHVEAGRKFKDYAWAECRATEGPTPIIALTRALVGVASQRDPEGGKEE